MSVSDIPDWAARKWEQSERQRERERDMAEIQHKWRQAMTESDMARQQRDAHRDLLANKPFSISGQNLPNLQDPFQPLVPKQVAPPPLPLLDQLLFCGEPIPDDWRGPEITGVEMDHLPQYSRFYFTSKWLADRRSTGITLHIRTSSVTTDIAALGGMLQRYKDMLNVRRLG